jgi:hypothetical protein
MNTARTVAITMLAVAHFAAAMAFGVAGDTTAAVVQLAGSGFWAMYGMLTRA